MGNNKVLKVALGKSEHDEHKPNLHLLSGQITGKVGLFFTTLPREDVVQLFSSFEVGCLGELCCDESVRRADDPVPCLHWTCLIVALDCPYRSAFARYFGRYCPASW